MCKNALIKTPFELKRSTAFFESIGIKPVFAQFLARHVNRKYSVKGLDALKLDILTGKAVKDIDTEELEHVACTDLDQYKAMRREFSKTLRNCNLNLANFLALFDVALFRLLQQNYNYNAVQLVIR